MAEDHGAPETGQLPRVWTRGRRETESCQRVSGTEQSLAGLSGNCEGTCVSKNFDETVRLQSEKRQEWIRKIRGERL